MSDSRKITSEILSMVIMGVLFLTMLILVVFSASAYRSTVKVQSENNELRAAVGYVITAVKSNHTDEISLKEIDGVNTLVIEDSISGLEQRIYFKDGQILENYGMAGYPFIDDGANVIGQAKTFEMSMAADGLLEINTDYGVSYVDIVR